MYFGGVFNLKIYYKEIIRNKYKNLFIWKFVVKIIKKNLNI